MHPCVNGIFSFHFILFLQMENTRMHYVFRRGWYYFMKLLSYISIYASVSIVMYNELHRVSHSQKSSKATGRGPRNRLSGRPASSPHAVTSRVLPVCHR